MNDYLNVNRICQASMLFIVLASFNAFASLLITCSSNTCTTGDSVTSVMYNPNHSGPFLEGFLEIYSALWSKTDSGYVMLLKGNVRHSSGRINYSEISDDLNSGNFTVQATIPVKSQYLCAGIYSPNNPAYCDESDPASLDPAPSPCCSKGRLRREHP